MACSANWKQTTLLLLVVLVTMSVLYLLQGTLDPLHKMVIPADDFDIRFRVSDNSTKPEQLCLFPEVNIFDPQIMKLAGLDEKTLRCDDDYMAEITYIDGLVIRVNDSKIDKKIGLSHCNYRNITREPFKDYSVVFSNWSSDFIQFINISDEHEFLDVRCYSKKYKNAVISKAFYSLVPKRKHLEALYDVRITKRKVQFKPQETLNIIGVALDGLPRHQMIRAMPKTYELLTKSLSSFDFSLHGQLADNTFPNFLGLLSGNLVKNIAKWWNFKKPEDAFDLIWHDFERAGYRTLYTEDYPRGGGFYWGNRAFIYPQTSYWNRPLELAMLNEPGFIRRKAACAGPRPISEYQLEYLTRFLDTFPNKPVVGVTFIINLTHDDSTKAATIDDHIEAFVKNLEAKGHLERSLLMFFSDHGQRWGKIRQTYNGLVESRNPFLLLRFPPWFLKKYPHVAENLKTNTGRLTSHLDTHQMLQDIMYFGGRKPMPSYRGLYGISLFEKISVKRTCQDAGIPASQCLCGQKVLKFLNTTDLEAIALGDALLKAVKEKSDPEKCAEYKLGELLQVGLLSVPTAFNKEKKQFGVASVRLTVKPGGAMFEGTVNLNLDTKQTSVGSDIERLNMYKGEVECQPTSREQMYCYCKGNLKQ